MSERLWGALHGARWTIGPVARHALWPREAPPFVDWATTITDPKVGPVRLTGAFRDRPGSDAIVVIVHGLGGATDAPYVVAAAWAAERSGASSLRIALRGADRRGEDFYHAALTADLHAAIASPELARFARVYVLGYSLGGHVTLAYGLDRTDPRVRAVAAICPPLDLDAGATAIEEPKRWVYLANVMVGLHEIYAAVARRKPVPIPAARARRIWSLRAWDAATIVPRHDFGSVENYYATASVGPRLARMERPALIVAAAHDPMIPPSTLREAMATASSAVDFRTTHGGHVGFPPDADLGERAPRGMEAQALAWLLHRLRNDSAMRFVRGFAFSSSFGPATRIGAASADLAPRRWSKSSWSSRCGGASAMTQTSVASAVGSSSEIFRRRFRVRPAATV